MINLSKCHTQPTLFPPNPNDTASCGREGCLLVVGGPTVDRAASNMSLNWTHFPEYTSLSFFLGAFQCGLFNTLNCSTGRGGAGCVKQVD